jgi:hypothetical protein
VDIAALTGGARAGSGRRHRRPARRRPRGPASTPPRRRPCARPVSAMTAGAGVRRAACRPGVSGDSGGTARRSGSERRGGEKARRARRSPSRRSMPAPKSRWTSSAAASTRSATSAACSGRRTCRLEAGQRLGGRQRPLQGERLPRAAPAQGSSGGIDQPDEPRVGLPLLLHPSQERPGGGLRMRGGQPLPSSSEPSSNRSSRSATTAPLAKGSSSRRPLGLPMPRAIKRSMTPCRRRRASLTARRLRRRGGRKSSTESAWSSSQSSATARIARPRTHRDGSVPPRAPRRLRRGCRGRP